MNEKLEQEIRRWLESGSITATRVDYLMNGDRIRFKYLPRHDDEIFDGVVNSTMFSHPSDFEIIPIPITPEILEKNGFVNKKGRFMQKGNFDDPPLIMWHLVDDKILGHPKSQLEIHYGEKSMHVSLVCIYVHELQHALRLCGIEKEIELNDNLTK